MAALRGDISFRYLKQFFLVYLFICIQVEEVKIPIPQHSKMLIYLCLHVEEGNPLPIPQHSKLFIYLYLHVEEGKIAIPQHSKLFIYLYLHVKEGRIPIPQHSKLFIYLFIYLFVSPC